MSDPSIAKAASLQEWDRVEAFCEQDEARDLNDKKIRIHVEKCVSDVQHEYMGHTALGWAALRNNDAMVRFLVEHGARVNAIDSRGYTALHEVAWHGYVESARVLLTAPGIDLNVRTHKGKTARDWAALNRRDEIVKLIDAVYMCVCSFSSHSPCFHSLTAADAAAATKMSMQS